MRSSGAAMAYRLPAKLGSLVLPRAEQVQQRQPWQGVPTLTFMNGSQGSFQDVYVTAVEADGGCRIDLWPRRFYVYPGAYRTQHNDITAWVKRHAPPICALMPDRLPDLAANALNQAAFSNLSRMLLDNQMLTPGALGPGQSARCWDDDLSNVVFPVAPCWSDILILTFP
ncbi:hypothetical protein BC827DRAFT_1232856 [Russula dissimulans]|nr:hypothetical protein BC827DRAFT_1232856 [Russula dissimulans]